MRRVTGQCKMPDPTRRGAPHHTPHPAIQHGHQANGRGTPCNRREGRQHTPAFHLRCHPNSPCHPTIHDGHPSATTRGRPDRGYPTTQTPQTHTLHYTTDLATNSGQHDCSTHQYCSGMSRARGTPPHWAGQQHTPPPFNTPHTEERRTPSTHLTLFTFTQPTNDHDQH